MKENNNLPPLPLVDGALLLDNSTLELLQTCPRSMEYAYLRKRTLAREKPALNFGSAIHAALAFRYKQFEDRPLSTDNLVQVLDVLDQHFLANPQPDGDYRTLSLARSLIESYLKVWSREPFKVVQGKVEASFALRIAFIHRITGEIRPYKGEKTWTNDWYLICYIGRIDLVVEENTGLWVMDHKTSSMFGDTFWNEMAMTAQQLGYVWACKQSLGRTPRGYIINGIRTRKPTRLDEYDETKMVRADDFARQQFVVTEDMLAEWQENVLSLVREFLWHHSNNYMPRKTKWCVGKYGLCPFYDVCSLPRSSREQMLMSSQYEDSIWSPLNKPKA